MGLRLDTPKYTFSDDFMELLDFEDYNFILDYCNGLDAKAGQERARGYVDDDDFMRRTTLFCYQNIALPGYGIHRPYIAQILRLTAGKADCTLIDVGAGGGQVGLAFHALGYRVSFADVQSESLTFLMYRLHSRGLDLPVYDLSSGQEIPMHNIAICFDVLEHIRESERWAAIDGLTKMGEVVFANLVREEESEKGTNLVADGVHYPLDMDEVRDYVVGKYQTRWQDYYPDKNGVPRQRLLVFTGMGVKT
jgi:2-polyprenyl-3-methyl-5-hydroxy-6-metoxy-1,4-benzoquinol methylase